MKALGADVVTALADDDGDTLPDAGVLEEALAAAEREVRLRLGVRADGDAPQLPAPVDDIVVTLAVERLYERRREALPGPWAERSERARLLLGEIVAGRHPLPGFTSAGRRVLATPRDSAPAQRLLLTLALLAAWETDSNAHDDLWI